MRVLVLAYGLVSYVVFFIAFCYAIGFTGNLVVPKGIDAGTPVGTLESIVINVLLLSLFAVQHTIMARPAFKRWWTTIIPRPMERSTFVLLASLILLLMYWQWRPMPAEVWHVQNGALAGLLWVLFFAGWGTVLYSTVLIDHFDLFGVRQSWLFFRGRPYEPVHFQVASLYRFVRHPLMLGFIVAFWATPVMTQGHLLFAAVTTAYILIAIQIEERDLLHMHGTDYERYRSRVSMIVPVPGRAHERVLRDQA